MFAHCQNIHWQLRRVNPQVIANLTYTHQTKPMIDFPQPERFSSFKAWLRVVCDSKHGMQAAIAEIAGVTPQSITKWLDGGNIGAGKLKKIAQYAGIDYMKLRALADGANPKDAELPINRRLMTHTEMGAKVGRKWEELHEPASMQILGLIETLLALQKETHRAYSRQQMELVKQRLAAKTA